MKLAKVHNVKYMEKRNWGFLLGLPKDDFTLLPTQAEVLKPPFLVIFQLIQFPFPFPENPINLLQHLLLPCSHPNSNLKPWMEIPFFLQLLILQFTFL